VHLPASLDFFCSIERNQLDDGRTTDTGPGPTLVQSVVPPTWPKKAQKPAVCKPTSPWIREELTTDEPEELDLPLRCYRSRDAREVEMHTNRERRPARAPWHPPGGASSSEVAHARSGHLFPKISSPTKILPSPSYKTGRMRSGTGAYRRERRRRRRDPAVKGRAPRRRRRRRHRDRRVAVAVFASLCSRSRGGIFSTGWVGMIFFQIG
jgi:hypothetical protein